MVGISVGSIVMPLRSYWVNAAALLGGPEKLIPDQQDKLGQVLMAQWLSDQPHFFFHFLGSCLRSSQ